MFSICNRMNDAKKDFTGPQRTPDVVKPSFQELRIVLLGHDWLEKSLTGNTILGQQMFDISRDVKMCVRRQRVVNGQKVVVVNTPERWIHYSVGNPGLLRINMKTCVDMCSPGPHVFLMVMPLGSHRGREWTVEGPLELINDNVWRSTIVILTKPEKLRGSSVEGFIASHRFLGAVLEKCGRRFHLLDTSTWGEEDDKQIVELLLKVDEVVEGNKRAWSAGYVTAYKELVRITEEEKKMIEMRAKQRQMDVQMTRRALRSLMAEDPPHSTLQLLIAGPKHAGKRSASNTILGDEALPAEHQSQCTRKQGIVCKRPVSVVTCPSWNGRYCPEKTPEEVLQQINYSVSLCSPKPNAVLLVVRSDETFTDTDRLKVEEHLGSFGVWLWTRTLVLFTWGDKLGDTPIEEHIERWPALQWLVDKCGNRYHVFDNSSEAGDNRVEELLDKIEEMQMLYDTGIMLSGYVRLQKSNMKLEQTAQKISRQMKKVKVRYELLIQTIKEKEKLVQNILKRAEEKDEQMESLKEATTKEKEIEESRMKKYEDELGRKLVEAEREKNQLMQLLMKKERMITSLTERCVEKDEAIKATKQSSEVEKAALEKELKEQEQEAAALRKKCEKKDKDLEQMVSKHKRDAKELNETIKDLNRENEDTRRILKAAFEGMHQFYGRKGGRRRNEVIEEYRRTKVNFKTLEEFGPVQRWTFTPLDQQEEAKKAVLETEQKRPSEVDNDEKISTEDQVCQLEEDNLTLSWLSAGGAAIGATFGIFAGSYRTIAGLSTRSVFGAAVGALLGNLVVQGLRLQQRRFRY